LMAIERVGSQTLYPWLYEKPTPARALARKIFGTSDPNVAAEHRFATSLKVAAEPGGNVIRLQFGHSNPVLAAAAVNALVATFVAGHQEAAQLSPPNIPVDNTVEFQQRLDQADQALADFRAKTGSGDDGGRHAALLQQRETLMADLDHSAGEVAAAQQRVAALTPAAKPEAPVPAAPSDADARRAFELALVGAPNAPAPAPRAHSRATESNEVLRARAEAALQVAKARHSHIETQLATVEAGLKQWQDNQATEKQLMQARAAVAQDYQAAINTAPAAPPAQAPAAPSPVPTVRVIQYAEVPDRPTNLLELVVGAGVLASLAVGAAVALLSHLFRRGYLSPEALERRLGVPVLASIPDLSRLDRSFDRLSDYG
jgi:uncharacterized protein involved in exopolysaccharide biosynthesis